MADDQNPKLCERCLQEGRRTEIDPDRVLCAACCKAEDRAHYAKKPPARPPTVRGGECPVCGYAMAPFETECERCKRMGQQAKKAPAPVSYAPQPSQPVYPAPQPTYPARKRTSWKVVVFLGAAFLFVILMMAVSTDPAAKRSETSTTVAPPSQPTTAPTTPPAPPRVTSWVQVASWSGDGIKSTQNFTVSDEWAIEWTTQPGQYGDMNFQIFVYSGEEPVDIAANAIGAGHDTSYMHQAGTYYLKMNSGQPWQVNIWDKR